VAFTSFRRTPHPNESGSSALRVAASLVRAETELSSSLLKTGRSESDGHPRPRFAAWTSLSIGHHGTGLGLLEEGETIVDYTLTVTSTTLVDDVEVPTVTIDDDSEADGVITVWLKDGIDRTKGVVNCHVVTSAGREDERSKSITIRER
jgi:hypothetical protein